MVRQYLTDQELEAALYDDDDLELDYVDPDLAASSSESDGDDPIVEEVILETENRVIEDDTNLAESLDDDSSSSEEHVDDNGDIDVANDAVPSIRRRRPRPAVIIDQTDHNMIAPSAVVWKPQPTAHGRQLASNIMREAPGLKAGVNPQSPLQAFRLFFDDEAIALIVEKTNQKLRSVKNQSQSFFIKRSRDFVKEDILGLIGLLITNGAYKQNKDTVDELFSQENLPIYRATMSKHRFLLLLRCLRFDDKDTRNERKITDNFAAARELWTYITAKFPNFLKPSESVVIDEELITFHGRCKFRMFIPTKPGKYGIEANVLCDSENYYCFAAEPYAGKVENQAKNYNSGPEVVKRLVSLSKLENSGRNITMDRKFTSLSTTDELLKKKLTVVGTIMSNKRDVPLELRPQALRTSAPGTVRFAFRDKVSLVSYVPKPKKVVTVLSSMHKGMKIRDDKPEIILYYNSTKAGVDTLDKCVRTYSCRRGTRRWPMAIFFNLIDIAAYNAYVIFSKANENWEKDNPKRYSGRKVFLKQLGKELCKINMENRSQSSGIQKVYISALQIFGFDCNRVQAVSRGNVITEPRGTATRRAVQNLPRKGRCFLCPRSADRKFMKACSQCEKYICPRHTSSEERVITRKCTNC